MCLGLKWFCAPLQNHFKPLIAIIISISLVSFTSGSALEKKLWVGSACVTSQHCRTREGTYALNVVGKKKLRAIWWVANCQFEVRVQAYWVVFCGEMLLNALNCWWTDIRWTENWLYNVPMFITCVELRFVMVVFLYLYHSFTLLLFIYSPSAL